LKNSNPRLFDIMKAKIRRLVPRRTTSPSTTEIIIGENKGLGNDEIVRQPPAASWRPAERDQTTKEEGLTGADPSLAAEPIADLIEITDLCSTMQTRHSIGKCIGYMKDTHNHRHSLVPSIGLSFGSGLLASVTLETLLDHIHEWSFYQQRRNNVAATLASSLLQLHRTPWIDNKWSKRDVWFYRNSSRVFFDKLYISKEFFSVTRAVESGNQIAKPKTFAPKEFLNSFGIILLELCFGETIELYKSRINTSKSSINLSNSEVARGWCNYVIYQDKALYDPIEKVLNFPRIMTVTWDQVISTLYEDVVQPLQRKANSQYQVVIGEDLNWGESQYQVGIDEDLSWEEPQYQVGIDEELSWEESSLRVAEQSTSEIRKPLEICNWKLKEIPSENSDWAWWKHFKKTSTFMAMQRNRLCNGQIQRRVKVAILDTGYNKNDPLFREARDCLPNDAVIEFKDFVGQSKKPVDQSGHGTRIAYLLLKITQNVDLWIARVFEQNVGTAESIKRVKMVRHEAENWEQRLTGL
jgi:hypothetical protein